MLSEYAKKRRLDKTPEPPPARKRAAGGAPQFVVHKHAASRLHYDLRLELDGVLKSWAVPKGPSLDPSEKRLAVMVEDHPIDYGGFEGVIPEGEYGAGAVIVWDRGSYAPEEDGHRTFDRSEGQEWMRRGLAKGKLSFILHGEKLKGSWTLVKSKRGEKDWLLIKHRDDEPPRDVLKEDRSVVSGMTVEDLKAGGRPSKEGHDVPPQSPKDLPKARKAPFPRTVAPMLATLAKEPFSHPDWMFEPKLDGLRAIAFVEDGKSRLVSRNGRDVTRSYPSLAKSLTEQLGQEMVLDGEVVAPDEQGRPSFQRLQQRMNLQEEADIRRAEVQVSVLYYAFDLLYSDGYDLRAVPFEERRSRLERVLFPDERVRLVDQFEEDGEAAYEAAVEHGLEGVMAKRRDSAYRSGERSRLWLKVKATLSDEFVIGGYSRGTGARSDTFGALILGQYDEQGKLRYAGHVGTGFDERTLEALLRRLEGLRSERSPFAGEVGGRAEATWVTPDLVAEIKFAQRTDDGRLRAPVFLHLREDKPAKEVERVEVVAAPGNGKSRKADPPAAEAPVKNGYVDDVLEQLSGARDKVSLLVEGHRLALSNLDKALWPGVGKQRPLAKLDLLVYLTKVSPYLLPHLKDRPLTLKRFPDGIDGESFFQKHWDGPLPPFVHKVLLFSETEGDQKCLLCNNLAALLWLGQIADIELHTWYSRIDPEPDGNHLTTQFSGSLENMLESALNYPDYIVFDLDPYLYSGKEKQGAEPALNRAAFAKTREVAHWLHEVLDSLSLSAFVKTSGMTGLHVYVPILRHFDFDAVRAAAGAVGRFLMQQHPQDITMEWSVRKRRGKLFFDHNQNSRGKTLASAYSPRPSPEASVSVPLSWEELDKVYPTDFTILNVPERLATVGDPWKGILTAKHDLGRLLSQVPEIAAGRG